MFSPVTFTADWATSMSINLLYLCLLLRLCESGRWWWQHSASSVPRPAADTPSTVAAHCRRGPETNINTDFCRARWTQKKGVIQPQDHYTYTGTFSTASPARYLHSFRTHTYIHLSTTLTQILSVIHCAHINTFSHSWHPCGHLYSFTTPAWIPSFTH